MDYGQPSAQNSSQPFFTPGAGTDSENLNNVEPENNLDLTNHTTDWEATPSHDPREIGKTAISDIPAEMMPNPESAIYFNGAPNLDEAPQPVEQIDSASTPESPQALGEVVNLEPSPNLPPSAAQANSTQVTDRQPETIIKTAEKLHKTAVKAIDDKMTKLNQDGNIADFYDSIRGENGMLSENLKNSYNREIGAAA